jgi:hypothetical protein
MIFDGMTLSGGFSLTPPPPAGPDTIDYLLVAGGGGGGAGSASTYNGFGGGGGQVIYNTGYSSLGATTFTVTVGAGGTGGTANASANVTGTAGTNSSIIINGTTLTANAGGYGNNFNTTSVANTTTTGGGTSGSGNRAGYRARTNTSAGSSGGGDSAVGNASITSTASYSQTAAAGGAGTLTIFTDYGTTANNLPQSWTLSNVIIPWYSTSLGKQNKGIFAVLTNTPFEIGQAVTVSGTNTGTGSIVGYTNPTTYYIVTNDYGWDGFTSNNRVTNLQLSNTPGGTPITTIGGTKSTFTGLTFSLTTIASRGYFGGGGASTSRPPQNVQNTYNVYGDNYGFGGSGGGGNSPNMKNTYGWQGNSPAQTFGFPGMVNTGGGGAGAGGSNSGGTGYNAPFYGGGGAGGSGIVIISYADSYAAASATTGNPTITVAGGKRTYVFTSSGSLTF